MLKWFRHKWVWISSLTLEEKSHLATSMSAAFAAIALAIAVWQLWENNKQAKIAYTLQFLSRFQSQDFESSYRRGVNWMDKHPGELPVAGDDELLNDINWVQDAFNTMSIVYLRNGLDRRMVELGIGRRVANFYVRAKKLPNKHDSLDGLCEILAKKGISGETDPTYLEAKAASSVTIGTDEKHETTTVEITDQFRFDESIAKLLPAQRDERVLDIAGVRALVNRYSLRDRPDTNGHLRFFDGDIAYWYEQKLPAWELELRFLAMRIVLDAAARDKRRVATQGDLSTLATEIIPDLERVAVAKWGK
jgi:hypothetical protein